MDLKTKRTCLKIVVLNRKTKTFGLKTKTNESKPENKENRPKTIRWTVINVF